MTLITTLLAGPFVQHAGDRLVTGGPGGPDPEANKTVLYLAKDAVVSIGYTGLAQLDGKPTDQFLAEVLIGDPLSVPPPMLIMRAGRRERRDIGLATTQLMAALSSAVQRVPIAHRKYAPIVMLSGWRWRRKGPKNRDRGTFVWVLHPHGTTYHVRRERPALGQVRLSGVPAGRLRKDEVDRYLDQLLALPLPPDPAMSTNLLAELTREVADRSAAAGDPTVGRDCMTISMPAPYRTREIQIRFVPDPLSGSSPKTYSPWVVGPELVVSPRMMSYTWSTRLGPFAVRLV